MVSRASTLPGLSVVRASEFEPRYRVSRAGRYDPLRDDIAHIPFTDSYTDFLSAVAVRFLYRPNLILRKVVAVDCDNTLWKGVVGEDGPDGVEFEEHHLALQRFLVDLSSRGVLICLCSKNVEPDVWQVFEQRTEMPLRKEHIVAAAINWEPKSQNLRRLASNLNLGLDSFSFIDDNPVECAEVRAGCPEILTLEWPQISEAAQQLLDHIWEFDLGEGTDEDRRRTRMYKDEYARKEIQENALSFEDFIASLQLKISIEDVTEETVPRASQMTMRTNQFNFTTIRRTEAEIRDLLGTDEFVCRILKVSDRFGDYGIVGLLIVDLRDDASVDTFLMSCRVLGRGVEQRMAVELGRLARDRGIDSVRLEVISTPKNMPARQFLMSITPDEDLASDERGLRCVIPVEHLLDVKHKPAAERSSDESSVSLVQSSRPVVDPALIRSREEQIKRAAHELSDLGSGVERSLQETIGVSKSTTENAAGIRSSVLQAFSSVLRRSEEEISEIDELDLLDCDSLKVVSITVALTEVFPWLPSTLLFEHARVSAIVSEIVALSQADPSGQVDSDAETATSPITRSNDDLAVVGIGLRCAGADSPEDFWELLSSGASSVLPVPTDREFFLGSLEDDRPHWAGLLDSLDQFDGDFFGAPPREAQWLDPQLRILMEVTWTALEDAAHTDPENNKRTGVFVGVMYDDYAVTANRLATSSGSQMRSWEGFSIANRISQFMGFNGPSLAIETACSSSATALHQARQSLLQGDCDAAVVGGVNVILDPNRLVQLGRLGILSPDGQCRPFGDTANGTVMGEGAGVVIVKRLEDAQRQQDRIYGVIKGSGVSTGAGSVGFTAPNPAAQAIAARRCLVASGIDARSVSYIETHGTGTALGDPIEVRGLAMAYEDQRYRDPDTTLDMQCTIGSVKPNIGHLEAGAGILGVIKILLQLQHGQRVPSLTSEQPNSQIDFRNGAFSVQRELDQWPRPAATGADGSAITLPRRAALNSFGVGGSNAHIVIEEPPESAISAERSERPGPNLAVFSADRSAALRQQARVLRDFLLRDEDVSLASLCHSLATSKGSLDHRVAVVFETREQLLARLKGVADDDYQGVIRGRIKPREVSRRTAFLFTGQGSQYVGMGRELYQAEPVFREAVDQCAAGFESYLDVGLLDVLFADADSPHGRLIGETSYTQPALFALQFALAKLWGSWGVRPDVVIGHSIGEYAAACTAGAVTLSDAIRLVAERGRLMQALPKGGAMLAVSSTEEAVADVIRPHSKRISIAAINAPGQVVVSGVASCIDEIASELESGGTDVTRLTVSHAFHSPLMEPMLDDFRRAAKKAAFGPLDIPFLSTVNAELIERLDAEYWVQQIRKPVRFQAAIQAAAATGVTDFIEIGPHPVLISAGRNSLPESDAAWITSMRRDHNSAETVLRGVGEFFASGGNVDWIGFGQPFNRDRLELPAYAFTRKSHWLSSDAAEKTGFEQRVNPVAGNDTQLTYGLAWIEEAIADAGQYSGNERTWLIIGDNDVARDVEDSLSAAGQSVRCIPISETPDQVSSAVARQAESGAHQNIVLALPFGQPVETVATSLSYCSSIAKLLTTRDDDGKLWIVTRNAVSTGREAATERYDLVHAALWGFGRVFALEQPSHWGGIVDFSSDLDPGRIGKAAVAEFLNRGDEDQIAYRSDSRLVPRLERMDLPLRGTRPDPEALHIVTGATGYLGEHCARWLALQGARHLLLASRRGPDAPGVYDLVEELQLLGVTVSLVAADTSRKAGVDALLAEATESGRRLGGIIHAAGVDEQSTADEIDHAEAERILSGKALGAWWLHQGTVDLDLDYFALYSSMSAVVGSSGRGSYAAANAILDVLAHERRRVGLSAVSIDWGPWAGGGMASAADLDAYARAGNSGLEPNLALKHLGGLMNSEVAQAMVVDIDWQRFAPVYEARKSRPLIKELLRESSGQSDVDSSGVNSLDRILDSSTSKDRADLVQKTLIGRVREILELESDDDVDPEGNFFDMGMDSLSVVEFATRLEKDFKIKDPSLIADFPNVIALTEKLVAHLGELDGPEESRAPDASVNNDRQNDVSQGIDEDTRSSNGVVGYHAELEVEIDTFQQNSWPNRGETAASYWRWAFLASAKRLKKSPQMWLFRDAGKVVGETAAIPIELQVGNKRLHASWLVDSFTDEEYRSKGVGTRLLMQAISDTPVALSLGQAPYMRKILLEAGWHQIATLDHLVLPLRSASILRRRLGAPAAQVGGLVLDSLTRAKRRASRPAVRQEMSIEPVNRFGDRHDRLWDRMSEHIGAATVRDASFLNWKYKERHDKNISVFDVVRESEHVATVALAIIEAGEEYAYRRAVILDLICPHLDQETMWLTLDAVAQEAIQSGAHAIHSQASFPPLIEQMLSFGFVRRDATRHLLVSLGSGTDSETARVLLDGSQWWATLADSDMDIGLIGT